MSAPPNKPLTNEEMALFRAYHTKNPTWGSLGIILAEGNTKDHFVDACFEYALDNGDTEGAALIPLLKKLSVSQRLRLPSRLYRDHSYVALSGS